MKEQIKAGIKDGKPTSIDIAHLAGVSQPTVSRALRDSPLVNLETRRRIQAIARELNYKVDVNARNLRSQQNNTLALLLCEDPGSGDILINPFFLSLLGSITRASAQAGYDLLISFQQLSDDWNADYEHANKADGIIFLGYGDYTSYVKRISALDEANAHFITWGPVISGQPGHFIGCDNEQGGYLSARHLAKLGRKNIAFIGDISEDFPEFYNRHQGYLRAHKEAGLSLNPELVFSSDSSAENGYKAAKALLATGQTFDGLCCASDLIAIGAIKAIKSQGLDVPGDVSVVGFDDISTARYATPALTTIEQMTVQAGQLLVDNLLKLINGEDIESFLMPANLVVRESCGAPTQD